MEVKQHARKMRSNTRGGTREGDDKVGRIVREKGEKTPEYVIGGVAK